MLIQKERDLPKDVPDLFSLDFETKSVADKTIEGFSIAYRDPKNPKKAKKFYVPMKHDFDPDDVWVNISYKAGVEYLKWLVKGRRIIFHNAGFDLLVLEEHDVPFDINNIEDTMLLHWDLDTERKHALKEIMKNEYGEDTLTYEEAKKLGFDQFVWYAEHDAFWTLRLFLDLEKEALLHPKTYTLYRKYEMPFVLNMMDMNAHHNRIRVDKPLLQKYVKMVQEEIAVIESALKEELGDINFNSGDQLGIALKKAGYKIKYREPTEKMKAKAEKKGVAVKKNPALAVGDLLKIQEDQGGDIIDLIIYNRELQKLDGTYVSKINDITSEQKYKNEVIHVLMGYRFLHHGARSGRLSSSDPNMQNFPSEPVVMVLQFLGYLKEAKLEKRNKIWLSEDEIRAYAERAEKEKIIAKILAKCSIDMRKIFIPFPNHVFIGADFSQIELRMIAHLARDVTMIKFFMAEEDIHQQTADKATEIAGFKVTRRYAKTLNFGLIYGLYFTILARKLGIEKDVAKKMYDAYFELFSDVALFITKVHKHARRSHYVQTLLGRRRNMKTIGILDDDFGTRNYAENSSVSTTVSGSAADLIKVAMINIRKNLPKVKILLQIHDELLCEVHEDIAEDMLKKVKWEMENAMELLVPVVADAKIGSDWRAVH